MMLPPSFFDRLAVCSWSLQPKSPGELIAHLDRLGIRRLQIALDPIRTDPKVWGSISIDCARVGITMVSGMFGTLGEDYSTLESIRRTGGLVPDETWDDNWENIQKTAELAQAMGLKLVTFHAGFLPHEESDPLFGRMLHRIRLVAEVFAAKGIDLAFETGQETGAVLKGFLDKLGRPTVGVNFDPANMILYDKGDPIDALKILGPSLKQCHLKDARRTKNHGTWGEEVVVGTGDVDWKQFFQTLEQQGFRGFCCIEREAGQQREEDIRSAKTFLEKTIFKS